VDRVAHAIKSLPQDRYQIVVLGTGEKKQVTIFEHLAQTHPNFAFVHTFDERLARRIYAGADVMVVPSKFEPCGLIQMIAMRYGTLPLVRKTGGLADSVTDGVTGFVFGPYTRMALVRRMKEVIDIYHAKPKTWTAMINRVMRQDFSWKHQAAEYVAMYKQLLKR
jgi:starch synthase